MVPARQFGAAILAIVALPFIPFPSRAQDDTCLRPTIQLAMFDRNWHTVKDLEPSHFAAFYHRKSVRVISITEDPGPHRVLVLLDISGSMKFMHALEFDIADELVRQLSPDTPVAVMAFAQKTTAKPTFSTDRQAALSQLQAFRDDPIIPRVTGGLTALFQSMDYGLSAFGNPELGDVLYVITDGSDNASLLDWRKLRDELLARGIRVFTMQVRWINGPVVESELDLPALVAATGGSSVVLPINFYRYEETYNQPLHDQNGSKSQLALEIDMQARLISSVERVQIELPKRGRGREVELRLAKPSKDIFLLYQHSPAPCSTPLMQK